MKKQANESSFTINRNTSISIGIISILLSPLIVSIVFAAVTNEKIKTLERDLQNITSRFCQHETTSNQLIEQLKKDDVILNSKILEKSAISDGKFSELLYEVKLLNVTGNINKKGD